MWTELCEKNNQHYVEHTATHNAITAVYAVVAVVAVGFVTKKIAEA